MVIAALAAEKVRAKARAKAGSKEESEMIWCFIGGFVLGEIAGLSIAAFMVAAKRGDSEK